MLLRTTKCELIDLACKKGIMRAVARNRVVEDGGGERLVVRIETRYVEFLYYRHILRWPQKNDGKNTHSDPKSERDKKGGRGIWRWRCVEVDLA